MERSTSVDPIGTAVPAYDDYDEDPDEFQGPADYRDQEWDEDQGYYDEEYPLELSIAQSGPQYEGPQMEVGSDHTQLSGPPSNRRKLVKRYDRHVEGLWLGLQCLKKSATLSGYHMSTGE